MKKILYTLLLFLIFIFSHKGEWLLNRIQNINPSYEFKGSVAVLNANSRNLDGVKVFTGGQLAYSALFEAPLNFALYEDAEAAQKKDHNYSLLLVDTPKSCLEGLKIKNEGYRVIVHGTFETYTGGSPIFTE